MQSVRFDELPGVVIHPLEDRTGASIRVLICNAASRDARTREAVERAWTLHRERNPREYDGEILVVVRVDAAAGAIHAARERYRFLAVGTGCGVHVHLLAVTGVVTGIDQDGDECVLLGRRAADTRIYGGLWELGPSGGVKCPPGGVTQLGIADLQRALVEEGLEEVGIDLCACEMRAIAVTSDQTAASQDVIMRVRVGGRIDSRHGACTLSDHGAWEYVDVAWVPTSRLGEWLSRRPEALIPPSAAIVRWLGWT